MSQVKVAFCWYQPDEWEILKQTADDKEVLDDSYDDWKNNANDAIRELQDQGQSIQKVSIKIERLVAWCKDNGVENNSAARSRYVGEIAQQRGSLKA